MALFFKQLHDPYFQTIFTIDEGRYTFCVECLQEEQQELQLTKLQFSILSLLFREHPQLVSYDRLEKILKEQKIALPDATRLHRKVSELRTQLKKFHPSLEESIHNLRGIGYHLPSTWRTPPCQTPVETIALKDKAFQIQALTLSQLMNQGIHLTRKGSLLKQEKECIMDRTPFTKELCEIVNTFNKTEKEILQKTCLSPTDMFYTRLQAYLANFRTYIALSRISEYSITHEQWCQWFEHEIKFLYRKITDILKQVES